MPSHDLDGLTCVASRRVKFPQFAFANRIVHQCSGIGGMIFSQKLLVDGQGFREDRLRFRVAALPDAQKSHRAQTGGVVGAFGAQRLFVNLACGGVERFGFRKILLPGVHDGQVLQALHVVGMHLS